ncbi:MAG: GTPase HflX, partial [Acidimicrobiales bacterium]
ADRAAAEAERLRTAYPGATVVSALDGTGTEAMLRAVADRLRAFDRTVELSVPLSRGDVVAAIHRQGEVLEERYEGESVLVHARLDERGTRRFAEFLLQ